MTKYFILLLIAVSLFVLFGLSFKSDAQRNQPEILEPTENTESEAICTLIDIITLSDTEVFIPCKTAYVKTENCPAKTTIYVAVKGASRPDGGENEIKYQVSGGRIIGKGSLVQWDLSDVKEGVYDITVDFVDFNNERHNKTETITVRNCECQYVDACPTIKISTPTESVKASKIVTFTVSVSDKLTSVIYNWTISQGEIIEGQGTPKIKVKTTREMANTSLTATVEINSEQVGSFCETTASEIVSITK